MVNVPNTTASFSIEFFTRELQFFREWLEGLAGHSMTEEDMIKGIELHNANRSLIKDLYNFMKEAPPTMSGAKLFELLISGVQMPADEFNAVLSKTKEGLAKGVEPVKKGPRLLVHGNIVDDPLYIKFLEDCGANVVVDDTCLGTKANFREVKLDGPPLESLAHYYLVDFECPRTYHGAELDRFAYLASLASGFKVDGVILSTLSYCDLYGMDIPDVKRYLQDKGYPCYILDTDYLIQSVESQRSGVEAFVEMLKK
jgi:benzoyl-CoA reductase subunit C